MATKFTVSGKAQVAQASHEREKRLTNFGVDWNELRIGLIGIMVPTLSDDAIAVAEQVNFASYVDWFTFGLINNVLTIPGQAGTQFIGICSKVAGRVDVVANTSALGYVQDNSNAFSYVSMDGASIITNQADFAKRWIIPRWYNTGLGSLYALKLVVTDQGLATQTVTVSSFSDGTSEVLTPANAKSTLRALLTGVTYAVPKVLQWNSGGAALPLPDTWFLRAPFISNRIRWCVKGGVRIS
jgi:hypothetical protein